MAHVLFVSTSKSKGTVPGLSVGCDPVHPPKPLITCCVLTDGSGSMLYDIADVNRGLRSLEVELKSDEMARDHVDMTVIRFGEAAELCCGPVLARDFNAPEVHVSGLTPMGAALDLGLDLIEERQREYAASRIRGYVPWMIVITDGRPTDRWASAALRVHQLAARGMLRFHAVGTGDADMQTLARISPPDSPPRQLATGRWSDLFRWISMSMLAVTRGTPDDSKMPPPVGLAAALEARSAKARP
jgi:uncharacterized protein YegL